MIRRVAFKKAILAGVLGAAAWEVVVRVLIAAGVPLFDLVHVLGTLVFGLSAPAWLWWPAGLAMHLLVGSIWAIFYAYFFWSIWEVPAFLQGVLFSFLPAILAGLIMIPQMDFMLDGHRSTLRTFAIGIGWLGPFSVILGHLVYGVVLGSIYVRPVGYRVGKKVDWYG